MTFTREDVERLVPEAGGIAKTGTKDSLVFYIDQEMLFSTFGPGNALLTTRLQLEIARETLKDIAEGTQPADVVAEDTLQSIKKVGES